MKTQARQKQLEGGLACLSVLYDADGRFWGSHKRHVGFLLPIQPVPEFSQFLQRSLDLLGKGCFPTTMQAKLQSQFSFACQGHEISR